MPAPTKLFDEILEIADDASVDWVMKDGVPALDAEHVRWSALRIDARKWALARMAPKKYGDKLQLGGDAEGAPITVKIIQFGDA